jgi:hypothetical protein
MHQANSKIINQPSRRRCGTALPTPKHPRIALCVLKSPLDIFINSMQTLFSKVKSHNKETTKKNIVVKGNFNT